MQGPALVLQNSGSLSGRCSRIKFPQCSQGSDLKPRLGPGPPVPDGATDRSLLAKSDDIGKMKLQYFGYLMRRVDSLEKTLMLGGIGGRRRRG